MMFQVIQSLTPYTSEVGDCLLFSQDILLNCGFPVVSTMSDCPTFSDAVAYVYRCHATVLPFYVINLMPYIVFGGEYTCFLQVVYLLKSTVFSALRVFALWDRNWVLSGVVLILNIPPLITSAVSILAYARGIAH